jgi:peptidoglycan L-alanyl-D-glutamate endopeptidase CwlK
MFKLSEISNRNLKGVHPHLIRVVNRAISITKVDFRVIEGVRTPKRQQELFDAGASKTLNSRHLTGHAVDLAAMVGGKVRWDWPLYHELADYVMEAAALEGVEVVWGGDWKSFPDGPHWELPRKEYPA